MEVIPFISFICRGKRFLLSVKRPARSGPISSDLFPLEVNVDFFFTPTTSDLLLRFAAIQDRSFFLLVPTPEVVRHRFHVLLKKNERWSEWEEMSLHCSRRTANLGEYWAYDID